MAPDTDFDPDGLFNRNVFVKVANDYWEKPYFQGFLLSK